VTRRTPSTRPAELEAQIAGLIGKRDAQSSDTLYALSYQAEIDAACVELAAWRLAPEAMAAAETGIRDATHGLDRAQRGRSRGPVIAGVAGTGGVVATTGHLLADAGSLPLVGGGLLIVAAAALVLTARDRAADSAAEDQAAADVAAAQDHYAALVAAHGHAIQPFRVALPAPQEEPCTPPASPIEDTSTSTPTGDAATGGRPPTGSPTPAGSATASAA
jgi:hypothetical protein